jgi:hypothetical protein
MESFPEDWVLQHLQGPLVFRGVDYISCRTIQEDNNDGEETEKEFFQCLLCATTKGELKSPQSSLEHCRGRRHQRNYGFLGRQQMAWLEDQLAPTASSFGDDNSNNNTDDQDVLEYFMPFRRWHFGKWEVGLSCQLCGTAAFPNRFAIVEHCESSRRHMVLRNRTLYSDDSYHPEISETTNILERIQQLPRQYYGWHVERTLLRYLAAKEASMASLTSRRYAWYQVWKTLETFELRYRMSLLECAIWKQHMLQYDYSETSFRSLSELEESFTTTSHKRDYQLYRVERRKTSQATGIILGVIPFLKEEPKITRSTKV